MRRMITHILAFILIATALFSPVTAQAKGTGTCMHGSCNVKRTDGSLYCVFHTCAEKGCHREVNSANSKCSLHKETYSTKKNTSSSYSTKKSGTTKSSSSTKKSTSTKSKSKSKSSSKKYDYYDVYDYKSAQDFADDKYEEFYDYEDDYEDEDEAYDTAEDYWRDHH